MILQTINISMTKIKMRKNNLILLGHYKIILMKFNSLKIKFCTKIKTKITIVMKLKSFLRKQILIVSKKFKKMMINKILLIMKLKEQGLLQNSQLCNKNFQLTVEVKIILSKINQIKKKKQIFVIQELYLQNKKSFQYKKRLITMLSNIKMLT